MSVATARKMSWSEAEYLAFENDNPSKHEFLAGEIFAMAGAKPLHNRVASNTLVSLGALLRGRHCGTFNSDQRIYIPATGLYTYADGGVACGKWQIHGDGMSLLDPVLLYEVLSASTRDYDCGAKREHYQHIPSLRHILLIDQPTRLIAHHHRAPSGAWDVTIRHTGAVPLPDLGGEVPFDDIYLMAE